MNLLDKKIKLLQIKLASQSPRRQELIQNIFSNFKIVSKEIDEIYPKTLHVSEVASYLSKLKAAAYLENASKDELYITADTVVIYQNEILGKPISKNDAFKMLRKLSGNTHEVYTGVSILLNGSIRTFDDVTKVTFYELTDDEINYYIEKYQPMDKAGSYGIQEWMGYVGIQKMEGDFFNVMGLPLLKLYREINEIIDL